MTGKRAAIYARTATLKLSTDPKGLRGQIEACIAYCRQHGFSINPDLIKQEVASGNDYKERMGLPVLLEAAKRHEFDVLVVTALDRLSRKGESLAEIISELQSVGVSVACIDEMLENVAVKLFITDRANEMLRMQQKSRWN